MNRREFITSLSSLAATVVLPAIPKAGPFDELPSHPVMKSVPINANTDFTLSYFIKFCKETGNLHVVPVDSEEGDKWAAEADGTLEKIDADEEGWVNVAVVCKNDDGQTSAILYDTTPAQTNST